MMMKTTTTTTTNKRACRLPARSAPAGRVLFFLVALFLASSATSGEPQVLELEIAEQSIRAEIADQPETRQRGLMFRQTLPMDAGMLFVYPRAQRLSFWMQNTLIPLDIAFIDGRGIITEIRQMSPLDTENTVAAGVVPYALEVNAGWFEKHGIEAGAQVQGLPDWRTAEP